jgi:diamine N-acetyltransferase
MPNANFNYRTPDPGDALKVSVLLKTAYIQSYALDGVSTEFANFITDRFSPSNIERLIIEKPLRLVGAYIDQNPIAMAEINYTGHCRLRNIAAPELSKLYVLDRFHGTGVAQKILGDVESAVKAEGHTEIWLEVWKENPRAISFYKKHNFEIIGEVDFPMEENTYQNYVMNKAL